MRNLKPDVFAVGVNDWDRRLFDELIPLPDGTSYNAYIIKGSKKVALLDTVDPPMTHLLIENIVKAGVEKIDYIVSHHAEQDHSGSIPDILLMYPEAKIVTSPKCRDMLIDLLPIEKDKFITVEEGEEISLGDKTLRFIYTPWVHWPETISAYCPEYKILFSCDFFGSHQATSELYAKDEAVVYEAAKRYYAEIMMPFRTPIRKNLEKIGNLEIDMIAPSHGPVYDQPAFILDAYRDWVSDDVKNEVVIAYVSMHESTARMVEHFVEALMEHNITVKPFNLTVTDIGRLAISLVDAATVIIGTPTVLVGPHPAAAYAAFLTNALRPKTKFASVIGSYGWGGKAVDQIKAMLPNLKAEFLEPVLTKGLAGEDDYRALDRLADDILTRHVELGITT